MFNAETLLNFLQKFPHIKQFWVAYSGGMDSHVLLHALVQLRTHLPTIKINAIHINHQLNPNAAQWEQHCRNICQGLVVDFTSLRVNASAAAGESPEAAARDARYQAFANILETGASLLTAHHADDQAETLLLQLFRGAGPRGLSAMAEVMPFAKGYLLRPLLSASRDELVHYARQQQLTWIEDDSNVDLRFDRNYVRQIIFPLIRQRWPKANFTIARSAQHCVASEVLLTQLADQDLSTVQGSQPATLSVRRLLALEPTRRRNLLRHYLRQKQLSIPSLMQLQRLEADVLQCRHDAMPRLVWGNAEVRRYRDDLYFYPRDHFTTLQQKHLVWREVNEPLCLSTAFGILESQQILGQGIRCNMTQEIEIRYRQGGELCQPVGRKETHSLKKLFQEWAVPPWMRDYIPLLYIEDQLAGIVGYCYCEPFAAKPDQLGWVITLKQDRA